MLPMTERLRYYSADSISSIVERKSVVVTHLVSLSTSRAEQQRQQHADTSICVIHGPRSITAAQTTSLRQREMDYDKPADQMG